VSALENVVREDDDELPPSSEVASHANDLRDPARSDLHFVRDIEVEQRRLTAPRRQLPVAKQIDHLARMRLARDDEHLANSSQL
jgi:hypothetical protein